MYARSEPMLCIPVFILLSFLDLHDCWTVINIKFVLRVWLMWCVVQRVNSRGRHYQHTNTSVWRTCSSMTSLPVSGEVKNTSISTSDRKILHEILTSLRFNEELQRNRCSMFKPFPSHLLSKIYFYTSRLFTNYNEIKLRRDYVI